MKVWLVRSLDFYRWRGWRGQSADTLLKFLSVLALVPMLMGVMGLFALHIWSIAKGWFFSHQPFQLRSVSFTGEDIASYLPFVLNSGLLALSAAFLSVTVVFLWLYNGQDLIRRSRVLQVAIYLPSLCPK